LAWSQSLSPTPNPCLTDGGIPQYHAAIRTHAHDS
jgi:hypothetical protein